MIISCRRGRNYFRNQISKLKESFAGRVEEQHKCELDNGLQRISSGGITILVVWGGGGGDAGGGKCLWLSPLRNLVGANVAIQAEERSKGQVSSHSESQWCVDSNSKFLSGDDHVRLHATALEHRNPWRILLLLR